MFANRRDAGEGSNIGGILLSIVLVGVLAGLLIWSKKEDAEETSRLQALASKDVTSNKQDESQEATLDTGTVKTGSSESTEDAEDVGSTEDSNSTEDAEDTDTPEVPVQATGIVCWGDDLTSGESSASYSYRAVLQTLLQEQDYALPVVDKTLRGAGTLSVMTMAGVPSEEVQQFITAHQQAAGNEELPVTETGIRDLTAEQLDRSDATCIPIIAMGYYGGWNQDPQELIQQQEKILSTFADTQKFIILGVPPMDGSVGATTYDSVMSERWGAQYLSAEAVTSTYIASNDGQREIAEALLAKMEELGYVTK